jgi:hypothetical protein
MALRTNTIRGDSNSCRKRWRMEHKEGRPGGDAEEVIRILSR